MAGAHEGATANDCVLKPRPVSSLDIRQLLGKSYRAGDLYRVLDTSILPGVPIGDDAMIGAGGVATRDVPAGATSHGFKPNDPHPRSGGFRRLCRISLDAEIAKVRTG
jgi:hypothetical protein